MKIKKFTESDSFKQSVKDIFSYVIDEFNAFTMVTDDGILLIFDINSDYDQKDFKNLYDGIKLYESRLAIMNGLVECLEKLSIYSDVYYCFSISSISSSLGQISLTISDTKPYVRKVRLHDSDIVYLPKKV